MNTYFAFAKVFAPGQNMIDSGFNAMSGKVFLLFLRPSAQYVLVGLVILLLIGVYLLLKQYRLQRNAYNRLKERNKEILSANAKLSELNRKISNKSEVVSEQNSKLEELNELKNRLFSIVSHDVRSPVRSIQGMLDLLRSEALSKKELKELVVKLSINISGVSSFLENLLSWADSQMTIEAQPKFEDFDIRELIDENIELADFLAEQKDIRVTNELMFPVRCVADKNMISLVIRNLLNNAIKFTPVGGEVLLGGEKRNGKVSIYVRDNGVGISPKTLKQLFELKYITTEGTMKERGTGLGLMLCRDFVQKNGGEIKVDSKEGEGSVFYFSLPLAREMEPA